MQKVDRRNNPKKAVCIMHSSEQQCGIVEVMDHGENRKKQCNVRYYITGLTPGLHGFHLHQYGDQTKGCESMGPHYNPKNKRHGGLRSRERHAGDFGNIRANEDGEALGSFSVSGFNVSDIVGRGMVVHAKRDDLGRYRRTDQGSATTGNSGARVCCGVVALSQEQ